MGLFFNFNQNYFLEINEGNIFEITVQEPETFLNEYVVWPGHKRP